MPEYSYGESGRWVPVGERIGAVFALQQLTLAWLIQHNCFTSARWRTQVLHLPIARVSKSHFPAQARITAWFLLGDALDDKHASLRSTEPEWSD
jgi:hypothetical protein